VTQIHVDTERLAHMCWQLDWHVSTLHNGAAGLVRAVYGAPSYNGQYGPWLWNLAMEGSDPLHRMADHLGGLLEWLRRVTDAFVEADELEIIGIPAWAALIREMVESGNVPAAVSSLYEWKGSNVCPPWIDEATWQHMSATSQLAILRDARLAYEEQLARIERLRMPPWEKDESWLWSVTGINPAALESRGYFSPQEIAEYRQHLAQVRADYDAKWGEFLESQSIYKFGVGDDLSEAFIIYLFGLEGAATHGLDARLASDGTVQAIVVREGQQLLDRSHVSDPVWQKVRGVDRPVQYYDLEQIAEFQGKGYGTQSLDQNGERHGYHYNLCGQITSAASMGLDPIDVLVTFESLPDGPRILGDQTMGTTERELRRLMAEYGWTTESIGHKGDAYSWWDGESWQPKAYQVSDFLDNGQGVRALLNLDTGTGLIGPKDGVHDAPHWAHILQVVVRDEGEAYVRIYNSFMHREEWYNFDHVVDSWTPSSNYVASIETPPAELGWLPSP
jgi:hypothetical protein